MDATEGSFEIADSFTFRFQLSIILSFFFFMIEGGNNGNKKSVSKVCDTIHLSHYKTCTVLFKLIILTGKNNSSLGGDIMNHKNNFQSLPKYLAFTLFTIHSVSSRKICLACIFSQKS